MTTALRPAAFKTPTPRRYRTPVWLQDKASDDWEGTVQWTEQADNLFYADIEPRQYRIRIEGQEETIVDRFEMRLPWREGITLTNDCVQRFRTEVAGLFYYLESVVDHGNHSREYRLITTQRLELPTIVGEIPLLPLVSGSTWAMLDGTPVVRLESVNPNVQRAWD